MKPNEFEGMAVFRPPLVYELTGRKFTLVFDDGFDRNLFFKDRRTLSFGKPGEEKDYSYDCLKAADRCYYVNFEYDMSLRPRLAYTLVLDLETSLVTMALSRLHTNPKIPRMPYVDFIFGAIVREDGTVPTVRHGYTAYLVQTSIDWNYGVFDIAHVYTTERYYRVSFSPRGLVRVRRGNPDIGKATGQPTPSSSPKPAQQDVYEDHATFIKIRDNVYLVNLLETQLALRSGHGNSLLVLMDLDEMHDVGRSFGTSGAGGEENYTFGAFGVRHDASEVLAKKSGWYIR
ncbi:MAG: MoaF N-terminal domain-containing protein [Oscillospiraceae bacterium]|nr:MoaF N-terminal domain-containing protein [Oscillospiraceae bacterium]